ncbi:MAG TPA: hypothetical protein VLQ48_09525 [Chloroflexia bacterium]|nr:hypothetical protein [Chloroflexia bacterium]
MASQSVAENIEVQGTGSMSFDRFAGMSAIAAGVFGLLYSVAFVIIKNQLLYSICLLIGALATTVVIVALYRRVQSVEPGIAQLGLLVGVIAALGSAVHAGFDLGNAINPPPNSATDLPSQVDPRGLLTFGIAGLALLGLAWLMSRSTGFPKALPYVGYLLGALLIVIYLGRLIILDPNNLALLLPAAVAGLVVNPVWYIWLGLSLMKSERDT